MQLGLLMDALPAGGYVSALKAVPVVLLLLAWARLLTWADKDAQPARLPRITLNTAMMGGLVLAFALFLLLPGFLVAFPVMLVLFGAEITTYLVMRKGTIGLGDLQGQFKDWLKSLRSKKKETEYVAPVGQITLTDRKGKPMEPPVPEDPRRVSYDAVQSFLADPLRRDADRVDLAPAEGNCVTRYEVDGVTYGGQTLEKAYGAEAITLIKRLAELDLDEKRKPQTGAMRVVVDGKRKDVQIETRGSTAGEHLTIRVNVKKQHELRLKDLGMSEEQQKLVRDVVAEKGGIVLVASPKDQGMTTALYAVLREHDAFLTHILTVERDPESDLESVTQNKLPASAPVADEVKMVDWVTSQEPDLILANGVEAPGSISALLKFADTGRRVYIGMRAGNTFDALAQWRRQVGDDALAMKNLRLVIAGRVGRRLCSACKVGYRPDPETLRKLNMDPQRINQLFQARTQPLVDPKGRPIPCDFCKDLHYHGRLGIYEMLSVDDDVRQVVAAGGSINQLKAVFRKQRGRYLQEEALAQVEKGETSVQEVLRVLKAGDAAAPGGAGGSPPPPPRPRPTGAGAPAARSAG